MCSRYTDVCVLFAAEVSRGESPVLRQWPRGEIQGGSGGEEGWWQTYCPPLLLLLHLLSAGTVAGEVGYYHLSRSLSTLQLAEEKHQVVEKMETG